MGFFPNRSFSFFCMGVVDNMTRFCFDRRQHNALDRDTREFRGAFLGVVDGG